MSGALNSVLQFSYNGFQKIASTTLAGQIVSYTYDDDAILKTAGQLNYTVDSNGYLAEKSLGAVVETLSYNQFGEIVGKAVKLSGNPIFSLSMGRNKVRVITSISEISSEGNKSKQFKYDLANRLIEVSTDNVVTSIYGYDSNGNRVSSSIRGINAVAMVDAQDRLVSSGVKNYTNSLNGERISEQDSSNNQTKNFTYNSMGHTTSAQVSGQVIEYLSDAKFRRVAKKKAGQIVEGYVYEDQIRIIGLLSGNFSLVARFVYGFEHSPDYMITADGQFYFVKDHVGSVRMVINTATGAVVQKIDYDEFGNVLSDTNPGFQPFGFAGGLYDQDTKLVRFGARDYDPEIGRWISKDPILFGGGQANLYSYTFNDPVNFIDPSGKFGIAGVASGFISGMVGGYIAGGTIPAALAGGAAVFSGFGSAVGVQAAGAMACGRTGAAVVEGGASGLAEIFGGTLDQTRNYSPLFSPMIR